MLDLNQFVIRPICENDLDDLCHLAKASGYGFTSLPDDRKFLKKKLKLAVDSFASIGKDPNAAALYLFVLEDLKTQRCVGISGVAANIGTDELFFTFKVSQLVKASSVLGIRKVCQMLTLSTDYLGASELCTLFVLPEYRQGYLGRLLSRCRFLFMAQHLKLFSGLVIAEMRGLSDSEGQSPFWHAVGQKFFDMPFPKADMLTGMGEKQFIVDLMPEGRIYIDLLPDAAQKAIGEVHPLTVPAFKLLRKENFHYRNYVDIFDAGPTLECRLKNIKSIRKNKVFTAHAVQKIDTTAAELLMVGNDQACFKAVIALAEYTEQGVNIEQETLARLGVSSGDDVRVLAL